MKETKEVTNIKKVIEVLKNIPDTTTLEIMITIFERIITKLKIVESFSIYLKKENAKEGKAEHFFVYTSKNNNIKNKELFENIAYKCINEKKVFNYEEVAGYPIFAKCELLGAIVLNGINKNENIDIIVDYFSLVLYGKKTTSLANKDKLTGLYSRAYAIETLKKYEEKKYLYSIIIIDLDKFKHYNDHYGHSVGDIVLKTAAKIMKESIKYLKPEHTLARYGGEEFIIIVRVYKEETLKTIMEKVRIALQEADFSTKDYSLKVTASLGGCIKSKNTLLDEIIDNADKALYKAKESGRNKSIVFKTQN